MNNRSLMQRCRGAGLIELILVAAIAGILATLSLPGLASWLEQARAVSASRALLSHLRLARSVAITRKAEVVICPRRADRLCKQANDWQAGWLSFVDADGNRRRTPEEPILAEVQLSAADAPGIKLAAAQNGGRYIRYRGVGDAWPNGRFIFCPGSQAEPSRHLIVYRSGRARIAAPELDKGGRCL